MSSTSSSSLSSLFRRVQLSSREDRNSGSDDKGDAGEMVDPIFDYQVLNNYLFGSWHCLPLTHTSYSFCLLFQFRLILIGDSTVGKSSLLRNFTDGTFAEVSDPTVGVDFFARVVRVNDGTRIKLQLWDTAGQERFRSITKSYYRNSVGALLVYDICNAESFRHIPVWMMEARRHIEPHRAVFVLVGCKFDLTTGNPRAREVSNEEAREFAESHEIGFVETSAKTGFNVEDAFQYLTQQIYDKIQVQYVHTQAEASQ